MKTLTMTLYECLSKNADGLAGWLPLKIHRRGTLLATPRRVAWAVRVLEAGGYPSRILANRMGGSSEVGGPELAASLKSLKP